MARTISKEMTADGKVGILAAMMKTIRPNMFTFTGKLIPKLNRSWLLSVAGKNSMFQQRKSR